MDVRDAAYNVGHDYPGGARALAVRMGKNGTTLTHELNATGGAKLGLLDSVKMTQLAGDMRILTAFAAECNHMVLPLPTTIDPGSDDCMRKLAETMRESSELATTVCAALADDGDISENERIAIEREGAQMVAALQSLLGAVQARALARRRGTE